MQLQSPTSIILIVYSNCTSSQPGGCERIDFMLLMSSHASDHCALALGTGEHTKDQLAQVWTGSMSSNHGDAHTKQFEVPHAQRSTLSSQVPGLNLDSPNYHSRKSEPRPAREKFLRSCYLDWVNLERQKTSDKDTRGINEIFDVLELDSKARDDFIDLYKTRRTSANKIMFLLLNTWARDSRLSNIGSMVSSECMKAKETVRRPEVEPLSCAIKDLCEGHGRP